MGIFLRPIVSSGSGRTTWSGVEKVRWTRVCRPVQPPFQGQVLPTGSRTVPTLQFTQKPLYVPAAESSVLTSLSVQRTPRSRGRVHKCYAHSTPTAESSNITSLYVRCVVREKEGEFTMELSMVRL